MNKEIINIIVKHITRSEDEIKKAANYIEEFSISSLDVISIVVEIEDYFNITLPTEAYDFSIIGNFDKLCKVISMCLESENGS